MNNTMKDIKEILRPLMDGVIEDDLVDALESYINSHYIAKEKLKTLKMVEDNK